MFPASSSQTSLYSLGFSDVPFGSQQFSSQTLSDLSGATDPNSQEAFKQSINLVQQHLARVQSLARSALTGIEHAYRAGTNPTQTAADLVALKQALHVLVDLLKQSGVGALPLLDPQNPIASLPNEEQLLASTTKAIEAQYARQKKLQDNAVVVFNLLGVAEQTSRK